MGFSGCWEPQLPSAWSRSPFSPPVPLPSLALPSASARDALERGRRLAGPAGQMAGRPGRILQRDPEKAMVRSFCFDAWSFFFRFPGHRWVSGSRSSDGVQSSAGGPLSCSGWTWATKTLERGWIQHHSFDASKAHVSPTNQENIGGERTKWDRNQGKRR